MFCECVMGGYCQVTKTGLSASGADVAIGMAELDNITVAPFEATIGLISITCPICE